MKNKINVILVFFISILFFNCSGDDPAPNDPTSPKACFTYEEGETYVGVAISFNADCSENSEIYLWDFGDNTTSIEKNPLHTYSDEGKYLVTLITTDSLERTSKFTAEVNILSSPFIEHSGYIDTDEVWEEGLHLVKGTVTLRNGSLIIKPGAEIYMNPERHIIVGDRETTTAGGVTLTAEGTMDKPIIFKPASGSKEPGAWGNILFTSGASDQSSMVYCELYNGGKANNFSYPDFEYYTKHGLIDVDGKTVRIENTLIDGAANYGINGYNNFEDKFSAFSNNTIRNTINYSLYLDVKYLANIGENNTVEGQPTYITGEYMAGNAIFKNMGVPYRIRFRLSSSYAGTDVAIEAGTRLEFEELGGISSRNGSFKALGTASNPIVFTSAQENGSPTKWTGLSIGGDAEIENSIVEYSGVGLSVSANINFSNNLIQYSEKNGLYIHSDGLWNSVVENNEIRDITGYGLVSDPSVVHKISDTNVLTNTQGFAVEYGYIRSDITWPSRTYVILGSILIISGQPSSLSLLPGTELQMTPTANIEAGGESYSYGHLIANGVTFINHATDAWGRIHLKPSMEQGKNIISNCIIEGGGYTQWSYQSGMIYLYNLGSNNLPTLSGNTLKNSINYGISTYSTTIDVSNNTFINNASGDTYIHN